MALRESVKWIPKLEDDVVFKMDSARGFQTTTYDPPQMPNSLKKKRKKFFHPDLYSAEKYPKPLLKFFGLGRRESMHMNNTRSPALCEVEIFALKR